MLNFFLRIIFQADIFSEQIRHSMSLACGSDQIQKRKLFRFFSDHSYFSHDRVTLQIIKQNKSCYNSTLKTNVTSVREKKIARFMKGQFH